MNPTTLTDLAAATQRAAAAQAEVDRAAERVFDIATRIRDERPFDETYLVEQHFGEWNSERNHIFWAETDFRRAEVVGDKVRMETGYTLRNERYGFWLRFPAEWLTLNDFALTNTLNAEWDKLLAEAQAAKVKEEQKQTWESYQTYLRLKDEFEGKPAPEEPKP